MIIHSYLCNSTLAPTVVWWFTQIPAVELAFALLLRELHKLVEPEGCVLPVLKHGSRSSLLMQEGMLQSHGNRNACAQVKADLHGLLMVSSSSATCCDGQSIWFCNSHQAHVNATVV